MGVEVFNPFQPNVLGSDSLLVVTKVL